MRKSFTSVITSDLSSSTAKQSVAGIACTRTGKKTILINNDNDRIRIQIVSLESIEH